MIWNWVTNRLQEASTWNGIAVFLTGTSTYFDTHGFSTVSVVISAVAAGFSALAGIIIKETN